MSQRRPNILYIMTDDHAAHAMSCYGSRINQTPHMDRIAEGGLRLDNCFCTNSICAPSRAVILTGLYSHMPGNGVLTLDDKFDGHNRTVQQLLRDSGYQTAMIGKWHLGIGAPHDPTGFDHWEVLPGQGDYHNPKMLYDGGDHIREGYVTDIITDLCLDFLEQRDPDKPFFLCCHHKAPHRPWDPDDKHADMYENVEIPQPETFDDDYSNRSVAAREAKMRIDRDLNERDTKGPPPEGLSPAEEKNWKYQRYIKDYLRCVASVDDNIGRLLDYLDEQGLADDTVVIYTSDQGFFLGDHGWYDKRFMYEESLRMPFVVRYPREIPAGSTSDAMCLNVDFAQTFLDYAGADQPEDMQGASLRQVFAGDVADDWRESMYYRYYMHLAHHNVYAHYGLRTPRFKLIYYYKDQPHPPEWELFDLAADPLELNNVYDNPQYLGTREQLKVELARLRAEVGDDEDPWVI